MRNVKAVMVGLVAGAFALLAVPAAAEPRAPSVVVIDAAIDRVEETWLVLDVPPHPSLPVPERVGAAGLGEGLAVRIRVGRDRLGVWRVVRIENGILTLVDEEGTFDWPRVLAPAALGRGDRVTFQVDAARRPAKRMRGL